MDTINLAPFNHTIYSRQSFHVVMMTESGEELKLVGGGEFFPLIIPFAEEIVYKGNQRKNGMIRLILWIVIYGGAMFLAIGLGMAFL